jgi:hypothetical protein
MSVLKPKKELSVDCILLKLRLKKVFRVQCQHNIAQLEYSIMLVWSENKETIHAVGGGAAREYYCLLDICTGWQLTEPFLTLLKAQMLVSGQFRPKAGPGV